MPTDETMFREVMGAIDQGQRARARDLLTRLLKTDQKNIEYWLWMSSVVDTPQERIYCLESILRLEPNNPIARRGLILAGALSPGDNVTPAPVPRRKWNITEIQAELEPQRRIGFIKIPRMLTSPAMRPFILGGIGLVGLVAIVIAIVSAGLVSAPHRPHLTITPLYTTPTAVPTQLPSETPRFRTPTATLAGPTPLWVFLPATYTAIPRYVATPHAAIEAYQSGLRAFDQGDIHNMVNRMNQAAQTDPNAADVWFYLGESQRLTGDYNSALESYETAISINPGFSPAYMGRALANSGLNSETNVLEDLQQAIMLDPNYLDPYYWHAFFSIQANDSVTAQKDLKSIERLAPQSVTFYVVRSMLYLKQGKPNQALQDAQRAHEVDATNLMGYYALGNAYYALENHSQAALHLYTYLLFNPKDIPALLSYGESLYTLGDDYAGALDAFDRVINLNDKLAKAYHLRGLVYLALDDSNKSVQDINRALNLDTTSFEIRIDLGRALLAANNLSVAQDVLNTAEKYAKVNAQFAKLYYWRAKVFEERGNTVAALADWRALLELPLSVVPPEWRIEALRIVPTSTPTATFTSTPSDTPTETQTITLTPSPSGTPTRTPIPSKTLRPTNTPPPTNTLQPSRTATSTATPQPTVTSTRTVTPKP